MVKALLNAEIRKEIKYMELIGHFILYLDIGLTNEGLKIMVDADVVGNGFIKCANLSSNT